MSSKEIKEYLKRIDELELKLTDEDKDTYRWILFGYNECGRLLNEKEQENKQLKENNMSMQEEMLRTWKKADLYKEVIEEAIEYINSKVISNGEIIDQLRKIEVKELLQILDKAKENK